MKYSGFRRHVKRHILTFSTSGRPSGQRRITTCCTCAVTSWKKCHVSLAAFSFPEAVILLVRRRGSRPLARSNAGSPRFTDFPSLCACLESSLTNLIGSGLNLLCSQSHSKPERRWTWPEVAILGADQKERCLWERELEKKIKGVFRVIKKALQKRHNTNKNL